MDLSYKKYPSKYELYHFKWIDIDSDREKLIKLIKRIKWLKLLSFISSSAKEELSILYYILESYDIDRIHGLLNNDEKICRIALLEKWSKIAAIEILLTERLSEKTYTTISNLPINDYQLLTKRIEELIKLGRGFTSQSDNFTKEIPGL